MWPPTCPGSTQASYGRVSIRFSKPESHSVGFADRIVFCVAASVAGLMIMTEAMVAETPKKKEAPAMPGGGMGGMDY
jgi:hypothetical protein